MDSQETTVYCYIHTDEEPPEIVSTELNIQGEHLYKGQPVIPGGRRRLGRSCWELHSRLPESSSVNDHILDLRSQFIGRTKALQRMVRRFPESGVMIVISTFKEMPLMDFDSKALAFVGNAGLSMKFDLYYYDDEDDDESDAATTS